MQNFFPSLDKPYFRADVFYSDGYSINDVVKEMKSVDISGKSSRK